MNPPEMQKRLFNEERCSTSTTSQSIQKDYRHINFLWNCRTDAFHKWETFLLKQSHRHLPSKLDLNIRRECIFVEKHARFCLFLGMLCSRIDWLGRWNPSPRANPLCALLWMCEFQKWSSLLPPREMNLLQELLLLEKNSDRVFQFAAK